MDNDPNSESSDILDDKEVMQKVNVFRRGVPNEKLLNLHDDLNAFVDRLKERFSHDDVLKHLHAYHALFGSGLDSKITEVREVEQTTKQEILRLISDEIDRLKASGDY